MSPKKTIIGIIRSVKEKGTFPFYDNTLFTIIIYYSIMLLVFSIIEIFLSQIGVETGSIPENTPIMSFTMMSIAPLVEEIGFRVTLIGGIAFFFLWGKSNLSRILRVLWRPSTYLEDESDKKREYRSFIYLTIILSGLFFGVAHITFGSSWEIGKLPTATIAGILLGVIYFKQGFPAAVILHWSFNFLSGSYIYFSCAMNQSFASCERIAASSLIINYFELLIIVVGIMSIGLIFLNSLIVRNRTNETDKN